MRILRRILIGWLWHTWRYRVTRAGKLTLAAFFCAWAPALPTIDLGYVHLIMALGSLFVMSLGYILVFRPRVAVHAEFPEEVVAEEPFLARLTLENLSRRSAYDVALGFWGLPSAIRQTGPEEVVSRLRPGERVTVQVEFCARRRGYCELPVARVFTLFPFHLFRRTAGTCPLRPVLVLPRVAPIEELDQPGTSPSPSEEVPILTRSGESTEYLGSRDYQPGDPTRRLDFRAMARKLSPVIREYEEERDPRVALVLDTFVPSRWRGRWKRLAELEAAISLAASIVEALSEKGSQIRFFAAGPELYVPTQQVWDGFHREILAALACAGPCRTNPFRALGADVAEHLADQSLVFFVLLDWDGAREELVSDAIERGCRSKVIIVRSGPTSSPFRPAEEWAGQVNLMTPESLRHGAIVFQ